MEPSKVHLLECNSSRAIRSKMEMGQVFSLDISFSLILFVLQQDLRAVI